MTAGTVRLRIAANGLIDFGGACRTAVVWRVPIVWPSIQSMPPAQVLIKALAEQQMSSTACSTALPLNVTHAPNWRGQAQVWPANRQHP